MSQLFFRDTARSATISARGAFVSSSVSVEKVERWAKLVVESLFISFSRGINYVEYKCTQALQMPNFCFENQR